MKKNNDEFLPKDYEIPEDSPYMKWKQGENIFRVLGKAEKGWEYWTEVPGKDKRQPIRKRKFEDINTDDYQINPKTGELDKAKHFWMLPVYNYKVQRVQVLEITQSTVQEAMHGLLRDKDWGHPRGYDLVVTRSGEGKESTKYSVRSKPHKELNKGILKLYEDMKINIESVFDNDGRGDKDAMFGSNVVVDNDEVAKALS